MCVCGSRGRKYSLEQVCAPKHRRQTSTKHPNQTKHPNIHQTSSNATNSNFPIVSNFCIIWIWVGTDCWTLRQLRPDLECGVPADLWNIFLLFLCSSLIICDYLKFKVYSCTAASYANIRLFWRERKHCCCIVIGWGVWWQYRRARIEICWAHGAQGHTGQEGSAG